MSGESAKSRLPVMVQNPPQGLISAYRLLSLNDLIMLCLAEWMLWAQLEFVYVAPPSRHCPTHLRPSLFRQL